MDVILVKDVDTLGDQGDLISVSEGYFRNYLDPKRLAVKATEGAKKDLEAKIERIRKKVEEKHKNNLDKAEKITAIGKVTVEANAGDTGKLYGAITTKDISGIIEEKTGLKVERKQINTNAPVNRVGDYEVYVKFSAKVSAEFALHVEATKDEAEQAEELGAGEGPDITFDEE